MDKILSKTNVRFIYGGKIKEGIIFGKPSHNILGDIFYHIVDKRGNVVDIPEDAIELNVTKNNVLPKKTK